MNGCWISPEGKIFNIDEYQRHAKWMYLHKGGDPEYFALDSYFAQPLQKALDKAYEEGWISITHAEGGYDFTARIYSTATKSARRAACRLLARLNKEGFIKSSIVIDEFVFSPFHLQDAMRCIREEAFGNAKTKRHLHHNSNHKTPVKLPKESPKALDVLRSARGLPDSDNPAPELPTATIPVIRPVNKYFYSTHRLELAEKLGVLNKMGMPVPGNVSANWHRSGDPAYLEKHRPDLVNPSFDFYGDRWYYQDGRELSWFVKNEQYYTSISSNWIEFAEDGIYHTYLHGKHVDSFYRLYDAHAFMTTQAISA